MVGTVEASEIIAGDVPARPVPLSVLADNIPEELKRQAVWLCWTYEWRHGRWTKVPLNPRACLDRYTEPRDRLGSSTDPRTWSSFAVAWEAYQKCDLDGVGISIDRMPVTGIDIDKCRNDAGQLAEDATAIVGRVNSYTEYSPSGCGLRILCYANKPGRRCRTANVEVYGHGRFLTITGHRLDWTPGQIERRQDQIVTLVRDLFPDAPPDRPAGERGAGVQSLEDAEIVNLASHARNGAKFRRLWAGDLSDYNGDHSRADQALCCLLAFYSRDEEQIERLFRASGLYRDK